MLAKLHAFTLVGIDAVPVEVEVDVAAGLPKTILVGLPELAVRESVHRIERALANLGYQRPSGRTIVNLAPADLKKDAGAFDLPIAVGMLIATGQLPPEPLQDVAMLGELALDGSVRPVRGVLSMAMAARTQGVRRLLVPAANAREAAVVTDLQVFGVGNLSEAVGILSGQLDAEPVAVQLDDLMAELGTYDVDFADVRGQEYAKRALVIAASGGHNVIMIGFAGLGQDDAVAATADHSAGADAGRKPGNDTHLFGGRSSRSGRGTAGDAPVPLAAPHHQRRRHGRRRGSTPGARRDQPGPQRRVVPRRAAGVQPQEPGGAASAAGGGPRHHLTGPALDHLSRPVSF